MKYLSKSQVAARLEVSERTIDRWVIEDRDKFPVPFKIGRRSFWDPATITAWINKQAGSNA